MRDWKLIALGFLLACLLMPLTACGVTSVQVDVCEFMMEDGVSREFTRDELLECRLIRFVNIEFCEAPG